MSSREAPTLDRLSSVEIDGSHKHIQTADVKGPFMRARRVVFFVLIAIYAVLPFVKVDGRPALQLDIVARRFYLFGAVFNAQDFWRVVFLFLLLAIGLVFLTAVAGRAWCGWACPQTVFLEGVYRPIERFFEGPREKRIRLAKAPLSWNKLWRKTGKHLSFLTVSILLAHVALALFVSLPSLFAMVQENPLQHWEAFLWTMGVTGALYFNFAWFREQLCVVVCPYGRLQSALLDRNSLIVGYDVNRGEPRGPLKKQRHALPILEGVPEEPKGDCVDCLRCVVVCPTGIDIRNGLQMECLACTQCIDACDDVMTRIGKPKGLIRYDSLNGLEGKKTQILRPRLALYAVVLLAALGLLVTLTLQRLPFESNVLRMRGPPFILSEGQIRNQFEIHLVSKSPDEQRMSIEIQAPVPLSLTIPAVTGDEGLLLAPSAHFRLPVFVSIQEEDWVEPFDLDVQVTERISGTQRLVKARFVGPERR